MNVLFVDDDSVVRTTTQRMLTRLGAQVIVLSDGAEVIPWLRAHGVLPRHEHSPAPAPAPAGEADATAPAPVTIDLVLSDIVMPGLDGETLCARLADLDLRVPVVAATGTAAPEALRRFPDSGFAGVLCKPYVVEQLAQVITGVKQNAFNPPKDVRDRRRSVRRR
jgi:CheY-like chemotaxis protein